MIKRNISQPINRHICHEIDDLPIGGDSVASTTEAAAYTALKLTQLYADTIATHFASETPKLTGEVVDETPGRKTRTHLAGRATAFNGSNQKAYIADGDFDLLDSDDDAFTVDFVFRCDNTAGNQNFWSCLQASTAGVRMYAINSTNVRVQWINGLGSPEQLDISSSTYDFMDSNFHRATVVYAGGTGGIKVHAAGREIASATTANGLNASTSQAVAFAVSESLNSDYGQCQIQLWRAWKNKALTAAECRDLYTGKLDLSLPANAPEVALLFNGPTIKDQSGNGYEVVVSNDPTTYQSKNVLVDPYDLNNFGWNESGGVYYPKRLDADLDTQGNGPNNANSFGVAKCQGQLIDGPCLTFTGSEYATNANLTGSETVVSSEGTSTPTISAGRIDFTAGTCWNLVLSNGSHYPMSEEAGPTAHDVENGHHLALIGDPTQGLQGEFFWSDHYGYDSVGTFDGVDDYVSINGAQSQLSLGSNHSGKIVFRFNETSTVQNLLGSALNSADRFAISIGSDVLRVGAYNGSHSSKSVAFTDTKKYHTVTWSYDAATHTTTAWLDGDEMVGASTSSTGPTAGCAIGLRNSGLNPLNGQIAKVQIDGGSNWNFTDLLGLTVSDSNELVDGTISGATASEFWGTKIPAKVDVTSLIRSAISHKAGPYINSNASFKVCSVDESPSARERFYGTEFTDIIGSHINADTDISAFPFSAKCDVSLNSSHSNSIFGLSPTSTRYYGLNSSSSRILSLQRRGGGSQIGTNSTHELVLDQWQSQETVFESATSGSIELDGALETFEGLESTILYSTTTNGLYIGQIKSTALTPNFKVKNFEVKHGATVVNQMPLYRDSLDWSASVNHGDDTDVTYLSETNLIWQPGDLVTNTHYFTLDSKGRFTQSVVLAG